MQYTKKSFSVASGGTQKYRDNWDSIFKKKEPNEVIWHCFDCKLSGQGMYIPPEHANHKGEFQEIVSK